MLKIPELDRPEIDAQTLIDAFKGYRFPRKAISDFVKKGVFTRVKPGIYIQNIGSTRAWSREIVANMIYGPSYISYEYALSYWGLIPERVYELTCATSAKRRVFDTAVGRFTYHHLPQDYYSVGYIYEELETDRGFLIATPEKALCDRIQKETGRFSVTSMEAFLVENLRIDPEELDRLELARIEQIRDHSAKQSIHILADLIKRRQA